MSQQVAEQYFLKNPLENQTAKSFMLLNVSCGLQELAEDVLNPNEEIDNMVHRLELIISILKTKSENK